MRTSYLLTLCFFAYLLISCSKDDACDNIDCANGGECINGICDCPEAWTGPDCKSEKTPESVFFGTIDLEDFPQVDQNGAGWDLLDGPDVYIAIYENNTEVFKSSYVENLTSSYLFSINYDMINPTESHSLVIFDYDVISPDDQMASIPFNPYPPGLKFPIERTFEWSDTKLTIYGIEYNF